jgi:hypothetical protein
VKRAFRFLSRALLLYLVAIGVLVAAIAGCCVAAMGLVWLQEGRLLAEDQRLVVRGAAWLVGACAFIYIAWRLANSVGPSDDSFRLTKSTSGSSEELSRRIGLVLLFGLAAIWLWPSHGAPAVVKIAVVSGWLCLGLLALHLHILLHELGHLLAAWALGFSLHKLQVGVGALVYSRSFANGFTLEWRLWPVGGFMFATHPSTRNFRVRQFLFVAGGPFMDAVILVVGYQLILAGGVSPAFLESPGGPFVCSFFAWVAMAFLGNLIPATVSINGQTLWSDARWLWMLGTKSRQRIMELLAQLHCQYAREQLADIQEFLSPHRGRPAPVNSETSRETFESQCLRLRSRLLPSR